MLGTPSAEVEIDSLLVLRLLAEQHPDLQHLPVQFIDSGWDNAMFRLGDRLAVRLPRRAIAAPLVEREQRWLPQLADRLPIPIPTPYRIGSPSSFYPWHWSIIPWLPGRTADEAQPNADRNHRFAEFLRALHVPAPEDAPKNPFRGIPLIQRETMLLERMQRIVMEIDAIAVVFDTVGNDNLQNAFKAAKLNGTVVSVVSLSSQDLALLHAKGLSLHLVYMLIPMLFGVGRKRHGQILANLAQLIDEGKLHPLLDPKQFSFADIAQAHQYAESGNAVGKVTMTL